MNWNIAQAKQQFSELVREAQTQPQIIYNREHPVAVLIAAEELASYQIWKQAKQKISLFDAFAELRQILAAEGRDALPELPARSTRTNDFVAMLDADYPKGKKA